MPEQPPYLRIADELRQRIAEHVWEPGDRLPSRAQIGQEFGVGENVVRRAQELLISQGVLEGRAGSGTYVAEPRQRVRVVRSSAREQPEGSPFRADMKAVGRQGDWESRTDAKVPAPAEIAARLGIAEGELCVRTAYEFLADGRPVQLSTSWEPYDLTAGSLVVLPEGGPHAGAGVVNRMAAIGITVSHAVEQPEPRQATAEEASLLGIQKAALARTSDGRTTATRDVPSRRRTSWCPPRTARSCTRFRSAGRKSLALKGGSHGLGVRTGSQRAALSIRALGVAVLDGDEVGCLIDEPRALVPRNQPQRGVRAMGVWLTSLYGRPQSDSGRVAAGRWNLNCLTNTHPDVRVSTKRGHIVDLDALGHGVCPQAAQQALGPGFAAGLKIPIHEGLFERSGSLYRSCPILSVYAVRVVATRQRQDRRQQKHPDSTPDPSSHARSPVSHPPSSLSSGGLQHRVRVR
ncbi:GntR family transcriptional regulator [Streptomyces violaceorubidus]